MDPPKIASVGPQAEERKYGLVRVYPKDPGPQNPQDSPSHQLDPRTVVE